MKMAMKDGKIMLIEVDNTQMAIIKSWNSMKYDRRKNMMIGDCSKELLDKLSKIVRLPPAIESYIYWVKTYNSTIADVKVSSDNPGEVDIVFLMDDGIPSQEMITGLTKYITDPNIRPLTDKVVVKAPTAVNYSISLTYYINSSDSGSVETIQSEVAKAVDDFVTWQQSKIGRDINSSELIKRVTAAGAKRVELKSPVFQKIGGTSIAYCTSKNVTYGGVEDD